MIKHCQVYQLTYYDWCPVQNEVNWLPTFFLRIPNFGIGIPISWFFNSGIQNKFWPESLESKTESEFRLRGGSQKSEPKIGIPNQVIERFSVLKRFVVAWMSWTGDMQCSKRCYSPEFGSNQAPWPFGTFPEMPLKLWMTPLQSHVPHLGISVESCSQKRIGCVIRRQELVNHPPKMLFVDSSLESDFQGSCSRYFLILKSVM